MMIIMRRLRRRRKRRRRGEEEKVQGNRRQLFNMALIYWGTMRFDLRLITQLALAGTG